MKIDFGGALSATEEDMINAILPGLGYFGHLPDTTLTVPISQTINRLELAIEAPTSEIMNISEIIFFDQDGATLAREDIISSISLSTSFGDRCQESTFDDFINGKLLHTKIEVRPSIVVTFNKPITISHISIKNRSDQFGARSRFIVVNAYHEGEVVTKFQNMTAELAKKKLIKILEFSGHELRKIDTKQELTDLKISMQSAIIDCLEKCEFKLSTAEIMELLPVFGKTVTITSYHIKLCAIAVVNEWKGNVIVRTSFLKPFQNVLSSDFAVSKLKFFIERLIEAREKRKANVVIARHHIHESRLLDRKEQFLIAIDRIISILEPAGIQVMLGYGTLLGAVREGAFMGHDDDVDLIVFDGSKSQQEATIGKQRIVELLKENGEDAKDLGFWHLHSVANGMTVDLFPTWQNGDELYITMQQLKIRPVPIKDILPASRVRIYNRTYPAPADCAAFLEDRYGPGWSVPDPYYEWPWKIDRIISGIPPHIARAIDSRKRISRKHFGRICRVAWGQRVTRGGVSPPMNSLPIIHVAIETGYDAVELDVRVAADDVVVLAHDDVLHGPDGRINVLKAGSNDITRFRLGEFEGKTVYVPSFVDALRNAKDIDVQIDSRINAPQVKILRKSVEEAGFDPTRLQFCVYSVGHAQTLLRYFPESVLMWKTYRSFVEVDEFFLDEAQALGMDGVMISVPRNYEDYTNFMQSLRNRNLRVLMFIHSGDEGKLKRMVSQGVDYVTTLAHSMETFKRIGGKP